MADAVNATEPVVVWGIGTSRTLRVHWLAHELGLDYEVRPVGARTGETQTPEYLAMSAKGKVPVLNHGSLVLTESFASSGLLSDLAVGMVLLRDDGTGRTSALYHAPPRSVVRHLWRGA